jgi:hypothetical protein
MWGKRNISSVLHRIGTNPTLLILLGFARICGETTHSLVFAMLWEKEYYLPGLLR